MIYRYLDKYKDFKCIADKCPATCCSGWAVEIDEDSLDKYKQIAALDSSDLLNESVNWEESCFESQANGDCACLDENGLCKLYIAHGEEALCYTCDMYPRHIEEFPNVREYSLSVSCPVVALDLLIKDQQLTIETVQDDLEEDMFEGGEDELVERYPDFDMEMYETLLDNRSELLKTIYDRKKAFDDRCQEILEQMKRVQSQMDGSDDDSGMEYISCLSPEEAFDIFLELEPLQPSFRAYLEQAKNEVTKSDFGEWIDRFKLAHPKWEIWLENIIAYFLYTYMCGAVYDEYVFAMTAQAVYSARMILYLWTVKWKEESLDKAQSLTVEILAQILYSYSRELEHSNENMILLEQLLEDNS